MSVSEYIQWLKRDWAKAGLVLSIFLFVFLVVFVLPVNFSIFLVLVQTPLYMLHQTEEYIFPGGFARFFNIDIFKLDTPDEPIDENFIFNVNIGLIWITLPVFGLLAVKNLALGLWIPYFSFFAGVAHIALALKARKLYNPGLAISLLLNIPIGLWSIVWLANHQFLPNLFLNIHAAIGFGVNALLPVMGVILFRNYQKQV